MKKQPGIFTEGIRIIFYSVNQKEWKGEEFLQSEAITVNQILQEILLHKIGLILKNLNFQICFRYEISLEKRKKYGFNFLFGVVFVCLFFFIFFPPNPSVFTLVALLHNGDDHIILSRCLHFIGYKVYTLKQQRSRHRATSLQAELNPVVG